MYWMNLFFFLSPRLLRIKTVRALNMTPMIESAKMLIRRFLLTAFEVGESQGMMYELKVAL